MLASSLLSAVPGLRHAFFTRDGGVSDGIYAGLNGGLGSNDDPAAVLGWCGLEGSRIDVDACGSVDHVDPAALGLGDDAQARRALLRHGQPLGAVRGEVLRERTGRVERRLRESAAENAPLDEVDGRPSAEDADDLVGE